MEEAVSPSILVITERFYPERFLINDLVGAWKEAGFNVKVITQVPSYPADRLFPGYPNRKSSVIEKGVQVTRFRTILGYKRSLPKKILNYLLFMLRASWYSLRQGGEVQAVFVYHTGPLSQAAPLIFLKSLLRKKTAIWTQDVWPDTVFAYGFPEKGLPAALLKAFVKLVYRNTDSIAVSSPGFVARLQPYVSKNTAPVFIPQWVPSDFVQQEDSTFVPIDTARTRFIFTGNVGKMQNLENVISAFSQIDPSLAHLYILGDGSHKKHLVDMVTGTGIRNVTFLDPVPQSQVYSYIRSCDFSILSLDSNPLIGLTIPAKFQAYLSAGRPIVAVTDGEVRRIVEDNDIGLCAGPSDQDEIVRIVLEAASSSDECRARWSANMDRLLAERYNKESIIHELTKLVV